jgi:hypothetical protein
MSASEYERDAATAALASSSLYRTRLDTIEH